MAAQLLLVQRDVSDPMLEAALFLLVLLVSVLMALGIQWAGLWLMIRWMKARLRIL
jgi:hypothetical protein